MASARDFFTAQEQERIVEAIRLAEKQTSGEIRLHIDKKTKISALDRASFLFAKLSMHKTDARNGVLLYMSIETRSFAIIGDVGINTKVTTNFWQRQTDNILESFRAGSFCEPLVRAIGEIGEELKKFFPYQSDDKNELSDEISF